MTARPIPLSAFAAASLLPAALIATGAALAGPWPAIALVTLFLLPIALDHLLARAADPQGAEFPAGNGLLVLLALTAFALPLAAIHGATSPSTGPAHKAALLIATGLWLGQIAHPAAHELIHRTDRRLYWLGVAVYSALLVGHHASSHRLIHHRFVATPDDPATARRGEGFWRFLLRASWQGYRAGFAAESARSRRIHPYAVYTALSAATLTAAALVAGPMGAALWVLLACHAQLQIHLSDYVQHYGLTRRILPDGKPEPVGPAHSWNSAHWATSALLLNAPRHSDHHTNPQRPYPGLRLPDTAPRLPWPLPLAALIALVPPLWRRLMAPELSRHLSRLPPAG
ncbi:alkane 1-monooxygenase [Gemmobacter aquarius]|uniref:Alkane 1-monooxygenase n=1 Tax=Paragemmobacter aquarius TaxID=2169400 RepID=A0A2S0UJ73_9RHOB|nr:alkane 1-monooxygenase [Gemmobacter aquarius]AWB47856.1 alkane 1-monooxygenase [Gemmobacter aquarius]